MDQTIRRIKKTDMSTSIPYNFRIHEYRGPKEPPMLTGSADKIISPLKVMAHTVIAKQRAMNNDLEFFKDVISSENIPEFNGYNKPISWDFSVTQE